MNLSPLELKIPPVAMVVLTALLMWVIARALPAFAVDAPGTLLVAACLVASGVAVAFAGVAAFRRARTTVNPLQPGSASSLVATGIYRRTRNPMYLGFALALLGWNVYLANPAALAALAAFVVYMNRFQIVPEERALAALFGGAFADYRRNVRRWI